MTSAASRAHARVLSSSVVNYKGCPGSGAWFSLQYLDRTEAARKHTCEAEEMDKEKKKRDKKSSKSDRVTLKKEIGLLSACAIIIGEWSGFCLKSCFMDSGSIR